MMKKILKLIFGAAFGLAFTSCQTTYDAYGNPRQSVDPAAAGAGILAAGVLGYALNDNDDNNYYRGRGHYNNHHRHHSNHGRYHRRRY